MPASNQNHTVSPTVFSESYQENKPITGKTKTSLTLVYYLEKVASFSRITAILLGLAYITQLLISAPLTVHRPSITLTDDHSLQSTTTHFSLDELNKLENLINQRKYFKTVFRPKAPVDTRTDRIPTIAELASGLVLVGILEGQPRQALIEDKKTQQILYISEGQEVNSLKAKEIKNNSVILVYNSEELELSI